MGTMDAVDKSNKQPGLNKNAHHTIFIYEKKAYHAISYNSLDTENVDKTLR